MKYIIALCLMLTLPVHAGVRVLFGKANLQSNAPVTVTGPLLQMQTTGGTTLSFQHGSRFQIEPNGAITLLAGNLRVGPAGGDALRLNLPQGAATVQPLTALTITATGTASSGKVYQGSVSFPSRSFHGGQGFTVSQATAAATFVPAAAEAPPLHAFSQPLAAPQSAEDTLTSQPEPTTPQQPPSQTPAPTEATPKAEPTPEPTPTPSPVVSPPPPAPTPTPVPVPAPAPTTPALLSTHTTLHSALIGFVKNVPGGTTPLATTFSLTLDTYSDGTLTPNTLTSSRYGTQTTQLLRHTATVAEHTSRGTTSGLARWVGGSMVAVRGAEVTHLANTTEGTAPSLHMVWGEKPTQVPSTGTVHYTLAAATQPTYTNGAASEGATFTGNLSITFQKGYSKAGTYHLSGQVTVPTSTNTTTPATVYNLQTPSAGVVLAKPAAFENTGTLTVTTTNNQALACPGGSCQGTVNIAGFGQGMRDAGALYTINPTGSIGIEGAALFTAQP